MICVSSLESKSAWFFTGYTGYTEEGKGASVRPAADICYFISSKAAETLAKNKDVVALLDKHCLEVFGPLLD